jgi:hypothetical protein
VNKKEKIFIGILAAILVLWIVVGALNWGYVYWPALAGALTTPFLLAVLFIDNLHLE